MIAGRETMPFFISLDSFYRIVPPSGGRSIGKLNVREHRTIESNEVTSLHVQQPNELHEIDNKLKAQWSSGSVSRFHTKDEGSIPGLGRLAQPFTLTAVGQ
ncbi:hypothetical protein TNCV_4779531 [Trichonephila clavipes]|nr:hypothetical protein TNCV_4779531 [Trichonephila clavipes]